MRGPWITGALIAIALGCGGGDSGESAPSPASLDAGDDPTNADAMPADTMPADGGTCELPSGSYQALYTPITGNCGAIDAPALVPFDGATDGVWTHIARFPDRDVTTELVVRDCRIRLSQRVEVAGRVAMNIFADGLEIDADGVLRGMAEVHRFVETGQLECAGTYAVELSRTEAGGGAAPGDDAGAGDLAALPANVAAAVQFDCMQTIQCQGQRGEVLPPAPLESCITQTAAFLAADASRQSTYLGTVESCRMRVVCEYVDCAASAQR